MKRNNLIFIITIFILFLSVSPLKSQVPRSFYKKGFPRSSGRFEPGVKGKSDIEFFYKTNYYGYYYDIKATFPFEKVPACKITKVMVNNREVKKFVVLNNYRFSKFKESNGIDDLVIMCTANWKYNRKYTVKAYGKTRSGKMIEISVSSTAPVKNVEFRYPDKTFNSRYTVIKSDTKEINGIKLNSVKINDLPVKKFKVDGNNILFPLKWVPKKQYNITLNGDKKNVNLKIISPEVQMKFGYPSSNFPYYYLSYTFSRDKFPAFEVKEVSVNNIEVRDFKMTDDGDNAYDKKVTGNTDLSITVRCNWEKGKWYSLTVKGTDENDKPVVLNAKGYAENGRGYWNNDWKYYATVILKETDGIKRVQEPVHIKMALYADRLTDPEKEIRVIEIDPYKLRRNKNPYREIPSQVYNIYTWNNRKLINKVEVDKDTGKRIIRYLPTTTLDVAFFADVLPYSEKVYLVFYGNPDALKPFYTSDLQISGPEIGQTVENNMFKIDLDDKSGAFFTIFMKQGKNVLLEHKLETNGAVHWNPGCYSPPHSWVHASDWENPDFKQITGPVFHMTKRNALLPHLNNVKAMITYIFYSGKPYVITTTLMEILEDIYVKALRNGEIVFNHKQFNEFVYKSPMGNIKGIKIKGSKPHPGHAIEIPYNTPWLAFINREKKIGFGGITIELVNTNKSGGLDDVEQPYIYVANGPWIYWSRALHYTFGSNNTSRMSRVAKGSIYYEKNAYMPFVLGDKSTEEFKTIEDISLILKHPLHKRYFLDTDNRNNREWVAPILVEPFDEGVKGAIGGKKKKVKK
ncbi:hypothetical protein DRQ09_03240 [candidate division KSB1 bacterium]|nr:MAG: hypothetical protein DRQ09_03240 [candidate division KSB1 bacterium]